MFNIIKGSAEQRNCPLATLVPAEHGFRSSPLKCLVNSFIISSIRDCAHNNFPTANICFVYFATHGEVTLVRVLGIDSASHAQAVPGRLASYSHAPVLACER